MNLYDWIERQELALKEFAQYYKAQNQLQGPGIFPLDQPEQVLARRGV